MGLYSISTKEQQILQKSSKTQGFRILQVANSEKVNIWGILVASVECRFLWGLPAIWVDKSLGLSPMITSHFVLLGRKGKGREFFLSQVFFHCPWLKIDQSGYLGLAYSELSHPFKAV